MNRRVSSSPHHNTEYSSGWTLSDMCYLDFESTVSCGRWHNPSTDMDMFNTLLNNSYPQISTGTLLMVSSCKPSSWYHYLLGILDFPLWCCFLSSNSRGLRLLCYGSWVIFMCIPFLARKGVNVGKLAHILAGNYFQCHFFLCLFWGGVDAPNMMWFTTIPIVSVLVGGIRHGIIWSSITSLSILGLYGLDIWSLMSSKRHWPQSSIFWFWLQDRSVY